MNAQRVLKPVKKASPEIPVATVSQDLKNLAGFLDVLIQIDLKKKTLSGGK
jgi:hypothetical protein